MRNLRLWSAILTFSVTTLLTATAWRQIGRNGAGQIVTARSWMSRCHRPGQRLERRMESPVGVGHASPVVANGRIYVFARQGDEEVLLCLDSITGKEIWRSGQPIAYEMHPRRLATARDQNRRRLSARERSTTFGITGVLSCHDAITGKLKWRGILEAISEDFAMVWYSHVTRDR